MSNEIIECLDALNKRHIHAVFAEGSSEAVREVLRLIPRDATVGLGDSSTVRQTGLLDALQKGGYSILNPFSSERANRTSKEARDITDALARKATLCDVFIAGTNSITRDGRIVNVDAVGNRVAGMFWGHLVSIIIIGRNKIVENLEGAFFRIRNVIAPAHSLIKAKIQGGKPATPCAVTGECTDCTSSERKCNVFSIIESKPLRTSLNVVIVNEDLGLGWDPSWPEKRIEQIRNKHIEYCWKPAFVISNQSD
ncbi:MAG: lactate utilization protein [Desulfobacteraceae bacterium]|nr:MAG: lactate utilization protein [Desulfobacteraceae bacterium]